MEFRCVQVDNNAVCQYENVNDEEHCVVNIFEKYLSSIPRRDTQFYCPFPDDGSGVPRSGNQPVGQNKLAKIIPDMCKATQAVTAQTFYN